MFLARPTFLAAAAATLLAACGGGGGGGINNTVPGVTGSSVGTPSFGQDLIVTLEGRNLDLPISASPGGCSAFVRSSTEPYVSSATKAYYRCTNRTVGSFTISFTRTSDSVTLARIPYTVPEPQVKLSISNGAGVVGDLVLSLEAAKAPVTVLNFLRYVNAGFYTDTVFHRLVPGFIIQGGGYAKTLVPGGTLPTLKDTNSPIGLEDNAGLSNLKWTIAMARTGEVASATSQFFFNLADNTMLDRVSASQRGYAVFGTLSAGTEVLTAMAAAPCAAWPDLLAGDDPTACVPDPNLVVTAATQTR